MRTLQYSQRFSLDDLSLCERAIPGPRDVLVRVQAVSLNYRDLAIARGEYGAYQLPLVPGSDASGLGGGRAFGKVVISLEAGRRS